MRSRCITLGKLFSLQRKSARVLGASGIREYWNSYENLLPDYAIPNARWVPDYKYPVREKSFQKLFATAEAYEDLMDDFEDLDLKTKDCMLMSHFVMETIRTTVGGLKLEGKDFVHVPPSPCTPRTFLRLAKNLGLAQNILNKYQPKASPQTGQDFIGDLANSPAERYIPKGVVKNIEGLLRSLQSSK